MSLFRLSLANLALTPLTTAVNILLLALGTASIAILLIAAHQLTTTLSRDSADIDLVIGAKGSPLQLVLAGVYHADVPPGNISLQAADVWMNDPQVASATPLALGDSFRGFRIVGTEHDYIDIYNGQVAKGRLWQAPLEIVVGAQVARDTGLGVGASFAGVHGMDDGGDSHDNAKYQVVGVLAETGTVLDRLLVTSMESVWLLHETGHHDGHDHDNHDGDHDHAEHHEHDEHHDHDEDHDHAEHHDHDDHMSEVDQSDREATVILIRYATPLAAMNLPRAINEGSELQAASPAFEITRLLQIVGIGLGWLQSFAAILLMSAALSIFAALYSSLKARRRDLAVLRCLGASRWELFRLLFVEGMALTGSGIFAGLLLAHGGVEIVGQWLGDTQNIALTGLMWAPQETWLVFGLLMVGSVTALIPAWQAFSTDVARTLAKP
ncbi:MAG: ABC transporter permease [Pseudomonadales bacterium]